MNSRSVTPLTPDPSEPRAGVTDATSTSSPRPRSTAVIHSGVMSASPPGTATSTINPPPEMSHVSVSNPFVPSLSPTRSP